MKSTAKIVSYKKLVIGWANFVEVIVSMIYNLIFYSCHVFVILIFLH
jgi:hypothetical protein